VQTNRINFIDQNDSAYLPGGDTAIIGYTTIKAPRGNTIPMKFPQGAEYQLRARFGNPTKDYPDIQEMIEFNNNYSLYVSAPPGVKSELTNYYGGVYATTLASFEDFHEVTDPENPNFLARVVASNSLSPLSTGTTKAYATNDLTIASIKNEYFGTGVSKIEISYPLSAHTPGATGTVLVKLKIVGTVVSTDIGNVNLSGGAIAADIVVGDIVVGTTTSQIVLSGNATVETLDFTGAGDLDVFLSTPANVTLTSVSWLLNIEQFVIQTFYQNSPRQTGTSFTFKGVDLDEQVGVPLTDNPYYNTISFSFTETDGSTVEYTSSTIICSPEPTAVDGYNQSLFYEDVFANKTLWYIGSKVYQDYFDTTGTWNFSSPITKDVTGTRVVLSSTFVDSSDLAGTLALGWTEANDPDYEEVNIFFDNSGIDSLKTTMASLRSGIHLTATFVAPIKNASSDTSTAVAAIAVTRASLPNTLGGLTYTCNEFLVRDAYGDDYYTPIIGTVAANLAKIMDIKLGGTAPMFTNDGSGLGGQLNRSVKKAKYKFTADHLDTLDAAGVNPIVKDSFYGLMLTSQKTAASAIFLTDWSFLGHAMAFDLLKREIKQNILIPQIGKAISPFYLELRQSQCEIIVNKRLQGATAIWTDAKVLINDVSVNNDETKMQNKFVVKVRVKVTPFAEYVEMVLNNVNQTTNL